MMKGSMSTELGIITISPEVIAKYAGSVAVECFVDFLADKNPRTDYDNKIEQQMNNAVLTAGGSSGGNERD